MDSKYPTYEAYLSKKFEWREKKTHLVCHSIILVLVKSPVADNGSNNHVDFKIQSDLKLQGYSVN